MSEIELRTFDGNMDELYHLIHDAWKHDYDERSRTVFEYTREYLSWCLNYPGSNPDLYVGAYLGGKLVGFGASFPQTLQLGKQKMAAVLSTFFTTDQAARRQGLGIKLIKERIGRMIDSGAQLNYFYLEMGLSSTPVYDKLDEREDMDYHHLSKMNFFSKVLDYDRLNKVEYFMLWEKLAVRMTQHIGSAWKIDGEVRDYKPEDLENCFSLINTVDPKRLSKVWSLDELAWQLDNVFDVGTLLVEEGDEVKAFVNYYHIPVMGRTTERITIADNIVFGKASFKQKCEIVRRFTERVKQERSTGILFPCFPTMDRLPLIMNLALPYPRNLFIKALDYTEQLPLKCVNIGNLQFR